MKTSKTFEVGLDFDRTHDRKGGSWGPDYMAN